LKYVGLHHLALKVASLMCNVEEKKIEIVVWVVFTQGYWFFTFKAFWSPKILKSCWCFLFVSTFFQSCMISLEQCLTSGSWKNYLNHKTLIPRRPWGQCLTDWHMHQLWDWILLAWTKWVISTIWFREYQYWFKGYQYWFDLIYPSQSHKSVTMRLDTARFVRVHPCQFTFSVVLRNTVSKRWFCLHKGLHVAICRFQGKVQSICGLLFRVPEFWSHSLVSHIYLILVHVCEELVRIFSTKWNISGSLVWFDYEGKITFLQFLPCIHPTKVDLG